MRSVLPGVVAAFLVALAQPVLAQTDIAWQHARGGAVPRGAMVAGAESNGAALYVCVAAYAGGYHPGKIRPGFDGCNIGYGGREIAVAEYDVAMGQANWVRARGGMVPGNALSAAAEASGEALYFCRVWYAGGTHPGKVRPGFNGCNIGYGGNEVTVNEYEVMVW